MEIPKEIYRGIKKDMELLDEWCALQHKIGCVEADHRAECARIAKGIKRNVPFETEPSAWWLCGEPCGEMLEVDMYHDAEHRTFYFLAERAACPAQGEEWIAYEYYPASKKLHQSYESHKQCGDNADKFNTFFEILKGNFGMAFLIMLGISAWLHWLFGLL